MLTSNSNVGNIGKALAALFLALVLVFTLAQDVEAQSFSISRVEVDGEVVFPLVTPEKIVEVQRGETLNVAVVLAATKDVKGLSVDSKIKGHEDSIEDETELFDLIANRTYTKFMTLKLPKDMDALKDYTLRVTAASADPAESAVASIKLTVQRPRHSLEVLQVEAPSTVNAGDSVAVNVVVKNRGYRREDDVFVKVAIPELGVSRQKLLGDLVTVDTANPDKEDTLEEDILVSVPIDAKTGNYALKVWAFNSDTESVVSRNLFVKGVAVPTPQPTQPTQINGATLAVDSLSKEVEQGEGVAFVLTLTNTGSTQKTFVVEVLGVEAFGTSRVDPSSLSLQPSQSGAISVFVKAGDGAVAGEKVFTVNVKADGAVSKSVQLRAVVREQEDSLRTSLIVAGVVLIVILVILVIVLAASRGRKEAESLY